MLIVWKGPGLLEFGGKKFPPSNDVIEIDAVVLEEKNSSQYKDVTPRAKKKVVKEEKIDKPLKAKVD